MEGVANDKKIIIIATIIFIILIIMITSLLFKNDYLGNDKVEVSYITHDVEDIISDIEYDSFYCTKFDDTEKYPVSTQEELVINLVPSPNYQSQEIEHEFVIIHNTEINLCDTLSKFLDEESEVSSHFVISEQGQIFMMVDPDMRAWHAGLSQWYYNGLSYEGLNDYAIGIELVNENSAIFGYSDAQMDALIGLLIYIFDESPTLNEPEQILGHEHISGGIQGKRDPGYLFDWDYMYEGVFGEEGDYPNRQALITQDAINEIEKHSEQWIADWNNATTDEEKNEIDDEILKIIDTYSACIVGDYTAEEWTEFVLSDRSDFNCK